MSREKERKRKEEMKYDMEGMLTRTCQYSSLRTQSGIPDTTKNRATKNISKPQAKDSKIKAKQSTGCEINNLEQRNGSGLTIVPTIIQLVAGQ